jgi:hypothetical protein
VAVTAVSVFMVPALTVVPPSPEPAGGATDKVSGAVIGISGTTAMPAALVVKSWSGVR